MKRRFVTGCCVLLLAVAARTGNCQSPTGELVTVFQVTLTNGHPTWITSQQTNLLGFSGLDRRPVWQGIASREWPSGLVPIFAVERKGVTELRRRPLRGQENFTDPLFFALPPTTEPNTSTITGRWWVRTHSTITETTHELAWELMVEGAKLAGRFDPATDYRFAYISGGGWERNQLRLNVDYINDQFELSGELLAGKLIGHWRRADDGDGGSWSAERPAPSGLPPAGEAELVALHAWQRPNEPRGHYGITPPNPAESWERVEPALGRVWRLNHATKPDDERLIP